MPNHLDSLIVYESVYSSLSLLNEYLWYDKLWGPSQRVVTLFVYVFAFTWIDDTYYVILFAICNLNVFHGAW